MTDLVEIAKDGRCKCDCGTKCPLGRCGMAERCTREELEAAGIPIKPTETKGTTPMTSETNKLIQTILDAPEIARQNAFGVLGVRMSQVSFKLDARREALDQYLYNGNAREWGSDEAARKRFLQHKEAEREKRDQMQKDFNYLANLAFCSAVTKGVEPSLCGKDAWHYGHDYLHTDKPELTEHSLTTESWREYEFGPEDNRVTYRINNPVKLFIRKGGTTHRVLDARDRVHCLPIPGEKGCVLRWMNKDTSKPCEF